MEEIRTGDLQQAGAITTGRFWPSEEVSTEHKSSLFPDREQLFMFFV
jgi:hypothetical protein